MFNMQASVSLSQHNTVSSQDKRWLDHHDMDTPAECVDFIYKYKHIFIIWISVAMHGGIIYIYLSELLVTYTIDLQRPLEPNALALFSLDELGGEDTHALSAIKLGHEGVHIVWLTDAEDGRTTA